MIGNKIAEKIVKPKSAPGVNSKNVEEVLIPSEEKQKILNELRQVLQNGISTVLRLTRKWIEVDDLSNVQYSVNKNLRCKTPTLMSYSCDCILL